MEDMIINICQELKTLKQCPVCGGTILKGVCDSCGMVNDRYTELCQELKNQLTNTSITVDIFIELVNILDLDISFVNEIVKQNKENIFNLIRTEYQKNNYRYLIKLLSKDNSMNIVDYNTYVTLLRKYYICFI